MSYVPQEKVVPAYRVLRLFTKVKRKIIALCTAIKVFYFFHQPFFLRM